LKTRVLIFGLLVCLLSFISCKRDTGPKPNPGILQLAKVSIGLVQFSLSAENKNLPVDQSILIDFNNILDTNTVRNSVSIKKSDNTVISIIISYSNSLKTISLKPILPLENNTSYTLTIGAGITGSKGESFPGLSYNFSTIAGLISIQSITLNGLGFNPPATLKNISSKKVAIQIQFSDALDSLYFKPFFALSGGALISYQLTDNNKKLTLTTNAALKGYTSYSFSISTNLVAKNGHIFNGFSNSFFTSLDSTLKFPVISDSALLDLVQSQTFKYFYDYAHPSCGMARERMGSGDVVTLGGSGFGVMALIVGMNRGFISRADGLTRLNTIITFLETCDRFHGAWPHWINGTTGKTYPFSTYDDGADLVETSFMLEGLLTMRQYLDSTQNSEQLLRNRITALFNAVEFDWFTQNQNVLYWHWSPDYGFKINMPIHGWDEALIVYILAASSPNHSISKSVYDQGWAMNGSIKNGNSYFGYKLPLGESFGGPLFFAHYSFQGLDPRNLQDAYANYWQQNVNHSLINWSYCVSNPHNYPGYASDSWGLTASDNQSGYSPQSPNNDLGVISPTAALSSFPYSPVQSMNALHHFYYLLGDKLWGNYGFYDAFNVNAGWWANSFLAIDQGPIVNMIENYRTGLLWNKFMTNPEVKTGLTKLGFTY
jgi:hypothetical protein